MSTYIAAKTCRPVAEVEVSPHIRCAKVDAWGIFRDVVVLPAQYHRRPSGLSRCAQQQLLYARAIMRNSLTMCQSCGLAFKPAVLFPLVAESWARAFPRCLRCRPQQHLVRLIQSPHAELRPLVVLRGLWRRQRQRQLSRDANERWGVVRTHV